MGKGGGARAGVQESRFLFPRHLKPVILKPVGRMSILREFDLPGVVPGVIPRTPVLGSELLGRSLGIPRTEKWPKTEHADDWVYCDWV